MTVIRAPPSSLSPSGAGERIAGILVNGTCVPGGEFRGTSSPVLHVWVVENPCGPFAGIDGGAGGSHGESCDHEHAETT